MLIDCETENLYYRDIFLRLLSDQYSYKLIATYFEIFEVSI